jgi:protein gp37
MAKNSKIEWTNHTANLWWGCTKVHEGCGNCYALSLAKRVGNDVWGEDKPRRQIKDVWQKLKQFQKQAEVVGEVHRVFVGSMQDIFEKSKSLVDHKGNPYMEGECEFWNTGQLRDKFFNEVVPNSPNLMFLLLTKRPSNINKYIPERWKNNPPQNVMFGTSPVNQKTANDLITQLSKVNGKRFISLEPQLNKVDLLAKVKNSDKALLETLDWVINGGESGHHKRPFNADWGRILRDDCKSKGVPFFFKQIDKIQEIPDDLLIREFPKNNIKNNNMKKTENGGYEKLTATELKGIYRVLIGKKIDLTVSNWSYNLMQVILEGVSDNNTLDINAETLFKKLFMMTDCQLLNLFIDSQSYWGIHEEVVFIMLNKLSPKQKLLEIKKTKNLVEESLKFDRNSMTELEFLMMSQSMRNDFIVFEILDEGLNIPCWSVNKKKINELLNELAENGGSFAYESIRATKEGVFKA